MSTGNLLRIVQMDYAETICECIGRTMLGNDDDRRHASELLAGLQDMLESEMDTKAIVQAVNRILGLIRTACEHQDQVHQLIGRVLSGVTKGQCLHENATELARRLDNLSEHPELVKKRIIWQLAVACGCEHVAADYLTVDDTTKLPALKDAAQGAIRRHWAKLSEQEPWLEISTSRSRRMNALELLSELTPDQRERLGEILKHVSGCAEILPAVNCLRAICHCLDNDRDSTKAFVTQLDQLLGGKP